jgi:molybdenum cofactor cytidylyltransferase
VKFGTIALDKAVGAILAHGHNLPDGAFKKGRVLSAEDVERLRRAGYRDVIAAVLEDDDVAEDEAAQRLAAAICGPGLKPTAPFTGRCNLTAERDGLLVVDSARLNALNLVDEAITIATLPPFAQLHDRQMVATVKIIPFSAPRPALERCLEIGKDGGPMLRCQTFRSHRAGLIQTRLPGTKESVLDKTRDVLASRLEKLHASLGDERRCPHDAAEIAPLVEDLIDGGHDLILIAGASAIVDRRDVIPDAIGRAGGTIDHFGMPVDPGNLLLLAHRGSIPVLGLPGCARSPKYNGLDMVLERLAAGLTVTPADIMVMGAGGLLKEMAGRPQPRESRADRRRTTALPRVAAVILAAGQSRRMGPINKLLAEVDGVPMVVRVIDAVAASRAERSVVVVGHEADRVRRAIGDRDVTIVENPDFADGLSTSLRSGLAALGDDAEAALICLGDMPAVTATQLDRLIAAFDPVEGRAICVPTHRGKRGNPVLWDRRFFSEMAGLSGDVGARHLIGANAEVVVEVEMDDDAVLADIDSPAALTALTDAKKA